MNVVSQHLAAPGYNIRFYNIALVFLIFDVEIAFLFPVILVLREFKLISRTMGAIALAEVLFFVIVLIVALIYAWRKGALDWIRTESLADNGL